jgi:hypothetical protein
MESDTAHSRPLRTREHGPTEGRATTIAQLRRVDVAAFAEARSTHAGIHPRVLSLDSHGHILDWISWQDAACLYVRNAVVWTLGEPCLTVHGGYNRLRGEQSVLDLHPIVAARGHARGHALSASPALTNTA